MNIAIVKKEVQVIEKYLAIKRQEKAIKEMIDESKPAFAIACEAFAEGKSQIAFEGTLIFLKEFKKYNYAKNIIKAENDLKAMKAEFEKQNEPADISKCWAVKS